MINLITCRLVELWTIVYKLIYTNLSHNITNIWYANLNSDHKNPHKNPIKITIKPTDLLLSQTLFTFINIVNKSRSFKTHYAHRSFAGWIIHSGLRIHCAYEVTTIRFSFIVLNVKCYFISFHFHCHYHYIYSNATVHDPARALYAPCEHRALTIDSFWFLVCVYVCLFHS